MIHQFDHRMGITYDERCDPEVMNKSGRGSYSELLNDPSDAPMARYWVGAEEVASRLPGWSQGWPLGWREKRTYSSNERTMIASLAGTVAAGDSILLVHPDANLSPTLATYCWPALNSFALDYVARQKVGGAQHELLFRRAVSDPARTQRLRIGGRELVALRVLELTYTAYDLAPFFAADLGYDGPPFSWDPERRPVPTRAELDAAMFRLYGIQR